MIITESRILPLNFYLICFTFDRDYSRWNATNVYSVADLDQQRIETFSSDLELDPGITFILACILNNFGTYIQDLISKTLSMGPQKGWIHIIPRKKVAASAALIFFVTGTGRELLTKLIFFCQGINYLRVKTPAWHRRAPPRSLCPVRQRAAPSAPLPCCLRIGSRGQGWPPGAAGPGTSPWPWVRYPMSRQQPTVLQDGATTLWDRCQVRPTRRGDIWRPDCALHLSGRLGHVNQVPYT